MAVKYRQLYEIKGLLGTAVNVQSMVFEIREITLLRVYVSRETLPPAKINSMVNFHKCPG